MPEGEEAEDGTYDTDDDVYEGDGAEADSDDDTDADSDEEPVDDRDLMSADDDDVYAMQHNDDDNANEDIHLGAAEEKKEEKKEEEGDSESIKKRVSVTGDSLKKVVEFLLDDVELPDYPLNPDEHITDDRDASNVKAGGDMLMTFE